MVEEDLKTPGIKDWREVVQDLNKWRSIVIATKLLKSVYMPEEEERARNSKVFWTWLKHK